MMDPKCHINGFRKFRFRWQPRGRAGPPVRCWAAVLLQLDLDLAVEVVFPSINYQKVSSSAGCDATTTDEDDMKLT